MGRNHRIITYLLILWSKPCQVLTKNCIDIEELKKKMAKLYIKRVVHQSLSPRPNNIFHFVLHRGSFQIYSF